ncbi:FtsW/RodA/SpoVE family cell cycle protein [Paenibacillus hamazuiensis]|uniref:FtsW/RodA/SpoVE family cell cycle protein n=1 Tax=Paenibacillus hamazuiensis TaxID=2936508 RepID=UPI00200E8CB7|nr:FtsW/RodA/SpoVE family cell cycle protein [Paenibacillus hamazuiensis]
MTDRHPLVQEYVNDICRQVRAKELRKEIKLELLSHLDELVESRKERGHDGDEAARWALEQMGNADEVASGLNRVHKPRIPWLLLGCLALLVAIALVVMYAVELSYAAGPRRMYGGEDLFLRETVNMALGAAALFAASRIDYRKLPELSRVLYGATVIGLLSAILWGPTVNGMSSYLDLGSLRIDFAAMAPYLFIATAAGDLNGRKDGLRVTLLHAALFSFVPMLLLAKVKAISDLLIYASAYTVLLVVSGGGSRRAVPHILISAGMLLAYILHIPNGFSRFAGFFHRHEMAGDAGYFYIQIDEAVRSAGWWGHGFAAVMNKLPEIHADTVFTYIVYSLGWFAGVFVLLAVLLFLSQLVKASLSVRDPYGRLLICGFSSIFAVQFVWNIGMSIGVLPISSVSLPFISYGGSGLLIQLAAVGIVYSVYRRKDMVRTNSRIQA